MTANAIDSDNQGTAKGALQARGAIGRRRMLKYGGILVASTALVACGSDNKSNTSTSAATGGSAAWDEIVSLAQKEGTAYLEGPISTSAMSLLGTNFEKKYGIKVESEAALTTDITTQVNADLKAGRSVTVDLLLSTSAPWLTSMSQRKELRSVADLPTIKEYGMPHEVGSPDAPAVLTEPDCIMYNTNIVGKNFNLDTYHAIFANFAADPKLWKSRGVSIENANLAPLAAYWAFVLQVVGEAGLQSLANLKPEINNDATGVATQVASGEAGLGIYTQPGFYLQYKNQGAPVGLLLPKDAQCGTAFYGAVPTKARNPNAGLLLLNYALSPGGAEVLNGNGQGINPLAPNVPGALKANPTRLKVLEPQLYQNTPLGTKLVGTFNKLFFPKA